MFWMIFGRYQGWFGDYLNVFFSCFESLLPSSETWSRPRRKARTKTTGFDRILFRRTSGVCTHLSLVLLYSFWLLQLLQHLRTCFCNAHPLNALPVPLLRQVLLEQEEDILYAYTCIYMHIRKHTYTWYTYLCLSIYLLVSISIYHYRYTCVFALCFLCIVSQCTVS